MISENSRDGEVNSVQWLFRKNCSLAPKQLLYWYFSIALLTLIIASGFGLMGYWVVLPFAGLELLVLAGAFLIYGRHATDFEMIQLTGAELRLVRLVGQTQTEKVVPAQWVRLEYDGRYKAPLVIRYQGQTITFGRFVAEQDKPALHKEMRTALAKIASGATWSLQANQV